MKKHIIISSSYLALILNFCPASDPREIPSSNVSVKAQSALFQHQIDENLAQRLHQEEVRKAHNHPYSAAPRQTLSDYQLARNIQAKQEEEIQKKRQQEKDD